MLNAVYARPIGRLYAWRIELEIRLLRFLASAIRAIKHEDWRGVLALSAAAWLAGLIAAIAAITLLPY
jgi:hypothetical protein